MILLLVLAAVIAAVSLVGLLRLFDDVSEEARGYRGVR